MPPRRSHKKSRAGCQRCKARKIKCDEVHPLCGNCEKHGVECDFATNGSISTKPPSLNREGSDATAVSIVARYASNSPNASSAHPGYGSPAPSISSGVLSNYTGTNRMLELRLLHNYTAATAKTLASNDTPEMEAAWMTSVPEMAFQSSSNCLLDAVFAVSALHMRIQTPTDQSLIRASHGYMASAISQYSHELLAGVNETNAEALFVTSAFIAFQASAARCFNEEVYGQDGTYTLPLPWFHSFQGVKAVVLATWKYIRTSARVRPIITAQPALSLDLAPKQQAFFSPLLDGLEEDLEKTDSNIRRETRQAYEHSVAFLNWCHLSPSRSRILGFPATVSRRFVELLESHDPRTLCIVACFFAMTKVVDEIWWLKSVAKREVNGILSLLPKEWWSKMDWALLIAHHEGEMDKETWGDHWTDEVDGEGKGAEEKGRWSGDVHEHIDILVDMSPAMPYGVPIEAVD